MAVAVLDEDLSPDLVDRAADEQAERSLGPDRQLVARPEDGVDDGRDRGAVQAGDGFGDGRQLRKSSKLVSSRASGAQAREKRRRRRTREVGERAGVRDALGDQ